MSRGAALLAIATLGGCANVARHASACRSGEQPVQRDALYFGTARRDGGSVADADWRAFERDVLVPAFPAGYSVLEASGHWRGADGDVVAEASRVVVVLHADDAAGQRAIAVVIAAYKQRFAQESVLRERAGACATF